MEEPTNSDWRTRVVAICGGSSVDDMDRWLTEKGWVYWLTNGTIFRVPYVTPIKTAHIFITARRADGLIVATLGNEITVTDDRSEDALGRAVVHAAEWTKS